MLLPLPPPTIASAWNSPERTIPKKIRPNIQGTHQGQETGRERLPGAKLLLLGGYKALKERVRPFWGF